MSAGFTMLRRHAASLLVLVPLAFALPVLYGIARSGYHLLNASHPFVNSPQDIDAQAIYLGLPIFQNPASGYTAVTYTPLYPLLIGLLDHVKLWSGWGVLLGILAELGLAGAVAVLAYRPPNRTRLAQFAAAAGAVGVAAIAWWFVDSVPFNFLYASKSDQFAWCLALLGLLALPRAADGSRRAAVITLVALSAAFWAKQTAIVASFVAVLWLAGAAVAGSRRWRTVLVFAGLLAAINGAVLLVLELVTHGWAWRLAFALPARHAKVATWRTVARDLFGSAALPLFFAAALVLAAEGGRVPELRWPRTRRGELGTLLALFVLITAPVTMYFERKQGSLQNQYVGVVWALGLLGGLAFAAAQRRMRGVLIAAGAVAVLFVVSEVGSLQSAISHASIRVAPKASNFLPPSVPAELRAFATRTGGVYHPAYSDIDVASQRAVYPDHYTIDDLLAGGDQPTALVRDFLDRRFAAVYLFEDQDLGRSYASGYGKWEEAYHWKLNQVLQARYESASGLPAGLSAARRAADGSYSSPGLLVRRPGPERDLWMRTCFGPFRIGQVKWRIGTGGGFWCRQGSVLRMRGTPAAFTEVRSDKSLGAPTGSLAITAHAGAQVEVRCGGWRVRARAGRAALTADAATASASLPNGRLRFQLVLSPSSGRSALTPGPGNRLTANVPPGRCTLGLWASRGSDASFALGALRTG